MQLRPATPDDLDLLRHWDSQPHVAAAFGGDGWYDWPAELAGPQPWHELLIAEADGRPVGFLEITDPVLEPTQYWGPQPGNVRAVDIWIGEAADLGRGLGTAMMRLALARCFADPRVAAVLVDPLATNERAHRFYERQGFHPVERRVFEREECLVLRLERADWERQARGR
jgi:aminoglycoside 6'-N-acetyltransferase